MNALAYLIIAILGAISSIVALFGIEVLPVVV